MIYCNATIQIVHFFTLYGSSILYREVGKEAAEGRCLQEVGWVMKVFVGLGQWLSWGESEWGVVEWGAYAVTEMLNFLAKV